MCFPLPTDNVGISYIAVSLYNEIVRHEDVEFITPVIRKDAFGLGITQCVPLIFRLLPWRYLQRIAAHYYEHSLIRLAAPGVALDLWSDHSPELIAKLRQKGAMIFKQKFNCAQSVAREILSNEGRYSGSITDGSIARELQQLALSDYVISPSPMVRQSLEAVGVPGSVILDSSFGWRKKPTSESKILPAGLNGPRFLYVGSVEKRKGAHLLLDYWKSANIEGTLIFMGAIRDEMKPIIESLGHLPNVIFLGHMEKAHGIYDEVDCFVFPSLEEGGPLVTYEAMARGLPVIVSPMGAGAIARDGVDGFVIPPHDRQAWINAMVKIASMPALRSIMGNNAAKRAEEFTWVTVARKRFALISERCPYLSCTLPVNEILPEKELPPVPPPTINSFMPMSHAGPCGRVVPILSVVK